MKTWKCECGNRIYFENQHCQQCGKEVGFNADTVSVIPLTYTADGQMISASKGLAFKHCTHRWTVRSCNWLLRADDPYLECLACRMNEPIASDVFLPPDRVFKLESAKRRLIFTLLDFGLPVISKYDDYQGMSFQFLGTPSGDGESVGEVITGHQQGKITINADEADDSVLEKLRLRFGEPYRTLLGHFRHESGHFYWDRFISGTHLEGPFTQLFGNASIDYQGSLNQFYAWGAPSGWQSQYISAYASAHPWEDWAETWAHYLHMMDTIETAIDHGLANHMSHTRLLSYGMKRLIAEWSSMMPAFNEVARSLGCKDIYPFVIYPQVSEKLQFVHHVIALNSSRRTKASISQLPLRSSR